MMRMTCVLFSIALFPFALACGDDSASEEVESTLSQYNESADQLNQKYCQCYADYVYSGDMNACMRDGVLSSPLETTCQREVAECYVDDYTVFLRCMTNAVDEFHGCISSCPMPGGAQVDGCLNTLGAREDTCHTNLPMDIKINMDACTTGEKFNCDN